MPVYEYKCRNCGSAFELMVRSTNSVTDLKCPSCGANNVQRLFSVPALVKNHCGDSGGACCGHEERCETPGCGTGGGCCGNH
jgi:putative FmdB family regulatory protein